MVSWNEEMKCVVRLRVRGCIYLRAGCNIRLDNNAVLIFTGKKDSWTYGSQEICVGSSHSLNMIKIFGITCFSQFQLVFFFVPFKLFMK